MSRNEGITAAPESRAALLDSWTQLQPNLAPGELHDGLTDRLSKLRGTTHLLAEALDAEAVELTSRDLQHVTAGLAELAWECWTFANELSEPLQPDS